MLQLKVNGKQHTLDIDPDTPLLWALRDHLNLCGTRYGCGIHKNDPELIVAAVKSVVEQTRSR